MPNRVRITTSCCQVNCGGQGDISINVQYTKPPKINHDLVANVCERPAVVARCPVAAIRPALVNGKPSLEVDEKKCICCGACVPECPVEAIFHTDDVPEPWQEYVALNAEMSTCSPQIDAKRDPLATCHSIDVR